MKDLPIAPRPFSNKQRSSPMPSAGQFVKSSSCPDGIGKLLEIHNTSAVIEFFDSPIAAERPRVEVKTSSLRRTILEPQTRVFFLDQQTGVWRAGRIQDHIDDHCFISLPNKDEAKKHESDVYTRWLRPIQDPAAHLAFRLTETPFFHAGRAELLAMFVKQRAASAGLTGLISAPVSLERHQVEVVRRVLQDPVQRYFLADEVGLGKTIEAGIIIRQYILDHPTDHRVLILAPEQLVAQWRTELHQRLQVSERYGHCVEVLSLEALSKSDPEALKAGMVVIDEAHQAVVGWNRGKGSKESERFELLRVITTPEVSPRLLLLSATPVRRNEDGFLALLHLLDPALYSLGDIESFRDKVVKRQPLADLFYAFDENQQSYFLETMIEELATMFPGDQRLAKLLAEVRPRLAPDADDDAPDRRMAIRAVRTHLSETYRLHRRLLRNRRTSEVEGLLPGRSGITPLAYDDDMAQRAETLVEQWRSEILGAIWGREDSEEARSLRRVYTILLEATWCDLEALACCAAVRLQEDISPKRVCSFGRLTSPDRLEVLRTTKLVEPEREILARLREEMSPLRDPNGPRLEKMAKAATSQLEQKLRVVVISTSPALADQLYSRLGSLSCTPIWRHRADKEDWHPFLDPESPGILVSDFRAEEGLNLQGGKACMLHADLPFSPNRIEQRLGRLDRFGVGHKVESYTCQPEGCRLSAAWLECLDGAYRVFNRSIASLQYVVDDEMRRLSQSLFTEGEVAVRDCSNRLGGREGLLEKEIKAIRAQDDLDSIEIMAQDNAQDLTDAIEEMEEGWKNLEDSCQAWLINRLHFRRVGENGPSDNVLRYHYDGGRVNGGPSTLMSLEHFIRWFGPGVDGNCRHQYWGRPLSLPIAFNRETARHRKVGLGRLGNPVIDGLHNYLRWDDRGTCFGIWRCVPGRKPDETVLFFRFDFVVESGGTATGALLKSLPILSEAALRRRTDAAFPPIVRTIWIDQDLNLVLKFPPELTRPYDKKLGDVNLSQQRWPLIQPHFDLAHWSTRCQEAAQAARNSLVRTVDLKRLIDQLGKQFQAETAIIQEQWTSRLQALANSPREYDFAAGERDTELRIREALLRDLESPRLRMDATGVVFLAGFALEA